MSAHAALIEAAETHAATLGVGLAVEWENERKRLTFVVKRSTGSPGSGAAAISHMLDLADEAGLEVVLDVVESNPALVAYYHRFGFRMLSQDMAEELADLEKLKAERIAFLEKPGHEASHLGVTFMWRETPWQTARRLAA